MTVDGVGDRVEISSRRLLFLFLVLYRWLSLIPPAISLVISAFKGAFQWRDVAALGLAIGVSLGISLFSSRLNRMLRNHGWLLVVDLLLVSLVVAIAEGWRTPYYLYALSPLIAAAFFFELKGAIIATTAYVPLFLAAVLLRLYSGGETPDWFAVVVDLIGFYLISGAFGSAAALLSRLGSTGQELMAANRSLAEAHRELEVLHALTAELHGAADIEEVQHKVLEALTTQLGFRRAVLGLVDQEQNAITGWTGRILDQDGAEIRNPLHPVKIPLEKDGALVAQALLSGKTCRATEESCSSADWFHAQFGLQDCLVMPMRWGNQPIGVLLVDWPAAEDEIGHVRSLGSIAQQTAVVLGMMSTRLRRASERAIQEERGRLALDIHDTVSQSMFGIVYTLDGLLKMLPADPEVIKPELELALQTAEAARQDVRQAIHDLWPEEIAAKAFEADLRRYVSDTLQANHLSIRFDIRGDFGALSPQVRRSLYRISQESLTNVVHHAAASEASVCVDVANGRARLVVRDNGRGFEPEVALAQEFGKEHFGLLGMHRRARALGGTCGIYSQPDAGSSIVIDIPVSL